MSDPRSASKVLIDRARPAFGPSKEARERMHAELHRRILDASAADIAAPAAPESGVRLSLKGAAGKGLAGLLIVLSAGTWTAWRGQPSNGVSPAASHGEAPRSVSVDAVKAVGAGEGSPVSPFDLPDAPDSKDAHDIRGPRQSVGASALPAERVRGNGSSAKATALVAPVFSASPTAADEEPISANSSPAETVPDPDDALTEELRLVREAQAALAAGELARTHRALDAHEARFSHGILREERLVLGVLLLCAEGHTDRALSAARELVSTNPRSSHFHPLRTSCASAALP